MSVPTERREKAVSKPKPRDERAVLQRLERLLASISLAKSALGRKQR